MAIDSRYKLKTGEEVAYFPPVQNTDNPYLTEAAMYADQANQLKGYLYVVSDVGHFEYKGGASGTDEDYKPLGGAILDILTSTRKNASLSADRGRALKELFDKLEAVLDIDESIDAVRNITMRNNGEVSSGLYMYDNPNTETLYQFVRYDAASNFVEFGSNDGDGEVISAKVDRGKTDWEFQDRIQILKPGRGISLLTPSAASLDGNSYNDKYELIVNEGGVLELYTQHRGGLGTLVWSSASDGSGSINNITEIPNRSYNDLQDKPTLRRTTKRIVSDTGELIYTLTAADKHRFLNLRATQNSASIKIVLDPNVFELGDEIEGYEHFGNRNVTIKSNMPYDRYKRGLATVNLGELILDGYFKIRIVNRASTGALDPTSALITGDFIQAFEIVASPDGNWWKKEVDNSGVETITAY